MYTKAAKVSAGLLMSGAFACAITDPELPYIIEPIQKEKYGEYTYEQHKAMFTTKIDNDDTCFRKIIVTMGNNVLCPSMYPLAKLDDTKVGRQIINLTSGAFVGAALLIAVGIAGGATWPVSVPLAGIYVAESKFGWKIC